MSTESKKVWVVGHKNPDTDSICAAISYAYLKNQSGDKKTYVAKRAGAVNEETRYVLERFGVEEPPLVSYAGAQIKDINIRKTAGVSNQISLKRAFISHHQKYSSTTEPKVIPEISAISFATTIVSV